MEMNSNNEVQTYNTIIDILAEIINNNIKTTKPKEENHNDS